MHSVTKSIGFRKVELVHDKLPDGEEGLSFYFKINGERSSSSRRTCAIIIGGVSMLRCTRFYQGIQLDSRGLAVQSTPVGYSVLPEHDSRLVRGRTSCCLGHSSLSGEEASI